MIRTVSISLPPTVQGTLDDGGSGGGGEGRTLLTAPISFSIPTYFNSIEEAYQYVQSTYDLNSQTVTINLPPGTLNLNTTLSGPLVGQTSSLQFVIKGAGPSSTIVSSAGGALFLAQNGAQFAVDNLQLQQLGADGHGLLVSKGEIAFSNVWFDMRGATALDVAGPQSSIFYAGGQWVILMTTNVNIFAVAEDHGTIYLGGTPGLTISGSPNWRTAFVQADLGGLIEGTGFNIGLAGAPSGRRFNALSLGIVFTGTGTGNPNFFPGSTAGFCDSKSVYS